jgi:hypothetical protein
MPYKVYIEGAIGHNNKFVIVDSVGKFITKSEADKQAAAHLRNWQKIQNAKKTQTSLSGKVHKPYSVRSRVIKVA